MIRINLLPHREEKRRARRQQFYAFAGVAAAVAAIIVFIGYSIIGGYIGAQEEKNAFLKREISQLDQQIEQIKRLREQSQALEARMRVIESLQRDRAEVVHLLNDLAVQLPEGIYLKSIKQDGTKVSLIGYAQSNARVSTLMRNMEASPWLERPNLLEIKAVDVNKRRLSEFTLDMWITRVKADDGKPKKAGEGKP